ncbi:DUF5086 family protein [Methylocucumis oryzae]|uniref:Uncharacterized protein n=1 Tax=Methylocucumis oryzae TaxID=1632867 RepID=A0A0F3IHI7_9GAMM|nr:DUF5086 family protein [Methylocucumis oryzae]KJV06255.1 hypothetical protein VZ94_12435 [Methylocucumis oryzae]
MKKILLILMYIYSNFSDAQPTLQDHALGIWALPDTAKLKRWVIIHNLADAKTSGIYHIEVIGRGIKDPAWKIQHLANHLAINEQALSASVTKPLTTGDVYPESFNTGFSSWQQENNGQGGAVCTTTVLECIRK